MLCHRERSPHKVYNQIRIHCEGNQPHFIDQLDILAVELKKAILEEKLDFTGLDDIILSHESCTSFLFIIPSYVLLKGTGVRTDETHAPQDARYGG